MRVTKQQITLAIDRATLNHDLYGCGHCWLNYLELILNIQNLPHPCSYVQQLLNDQYHTNYKITPGFCIFHSFPTAEILSKLNTRVLKI